MYASDRQVHELSSGKKLPLHVQLFRFLHGQVRQDASRVRRPIQWLAMVAAVAALVHQSGNARAGTIVTLQSGVSPTVTYQTQDAHVRNDGTNVATTDNNTRILFGAVAAGALRGLYSYPLSDIPAGAIINSVEFHVMQVDTDATSQAGDFTVELRSISQTFSQGAPVTGAGGSNWNNTFGASMTLGGSALSSKTMNPRPAVLPVQATPSTWIDHAFTTSTSLVAAVQAQLDANQPFNFALVVPSVETGGVRRFVRTPSNSEAATITANRPRLIIEYTEVPEPGTAVLVLLCAAMLPARVRALRNSRQTRIAE